MRFGPVPTREAAGAILAHTHRLGADGALRKGLILDEVHVERLVAAGYGEVVVARMESGDVGEDEAAARLARVVGGPNVELGAARTGRVNLFATVPGVLVVDEDRVDAVNEVDEGITVATLAAASTVVAGELLGTVKIIPYAVPDAILQVCEAAGQGDGPPIRVAPLLPKRAGLVLSTLPGLPARLVERAAETQRERLAALGTTLDRVDAVPHEVDAVARALRDQLDAGLDPVLFLGASAIIDRRDVLPSAVEAIGGEVVQLGMPVDPGNLLLVGRHDGRDVLGLPGCARSPKASGFDLVLRRVLADLPVEPSDIRSMGVGGLLKEIPARGAPRRATAGKRHDVAAIVLAAGRSRRMGVDNKLLVDLDGEPLLVRAVDGLLASRARPVIVVTGHEHEDVAAALAGKDVTLVHNPDFAAGMSTSLRAGLQAVPDGVAGVMVALGDMPFVSPRVVELLLDAFDPEGGAPICVPVHDRKRGHPVVWSRAYLPELLALTGDVGARAVLDAHADEVHLVPVDHAGVHLDVDTPEALAAVRASGPPGPGVSSD